MRQHRSNPLILCIAVMALSFDVAAQPTANPIIIGHRGASGERPEHTLSAYYLAILSGADFIEPDLVPTRDGHLIARHENVLAAVRLEANQIARTAAGEPIVVWATTNVADLHQFADRLALKSIDGRAVAGWFSEDFTLAEIRTLRARERIGDLRPRNQRFDNRLGIPTLKEIIALVRFAEHHLGRRVGLYPELKHPTYFAHAGMHIDGTPIAHDTAMLLIRELSREGFIAHDRVIIQAFEVGPLLRLKRQLMPQAGVEFPLVQLIGDTRAGSLASYARPFDITHHLAAGDDLAQIYEGLLQRLGGIDESTRWASLVTEASLQALAATYADGIGPNRFSLFTNDPANPANNRQIQWTPLLGHALAAGLQVHPYTLRAEPRFQLAGSNYASEALAMWCAGAQGFFTDHPRLAARIRARYDPARCQSVY